MRLMFKFFGLITTTLLLLACGGSGGGGSSTGSSSDVTIPAQIVGTYNDNSNFRFTSEFGNTMETRDITLTISSNGTVIASNGQGQTIGEIDGTSFTTAGTFTNSSEDGFNCSGGSQRYTGRIENNRAVGSYQGSLPCTAAGETSIIEIRGEFNLPRTSNTP